MYIYSKTNLPNRFYVYAYLRKSNSTPYYIGKGKGARAWSKHKGQQIPSDYSNIVILEAGLSEIGALALERRMIRWYGRKDIATGILRNQTDGGDGLAGYNTTLETRRKYSTRSTGERNGMYGKQHTDKVKADSSARRSLTNSLRRWYNDGISNLFAVAPPGGNWLPGRIQKATTKGRHWYTNGLQNVSRLEKPDGLEWSRGRTTV